MRFGLLMRFFTENPPKAITPRRVWLIEALGGVIEDHTVEHLVHLGFDALRMNPRCPG